MSGLRPAVIGPVTRFGPGYVLSCGGETLKIRVGGRVDLFEMSERFGPLRLTAGGETHGRQWAERDAFWSAFEAWRKGGMLVDASGFAAIGPTPGREVET